MNALALLAEFEAAGVHITREGDDLRVRGASGVDLAPYLDRIRAHKPALLRKLLQRQIVAAATAEPDHFDRAALDALWVVWRAQDAEKETAP